MTDYSSVEAVREAFERGCKLGREADPDSLAFQLAMKAAKQALHHYSTPEQNGFALGWLAALADRGFR